MTASNSGCALRYIMAVCCFYNLGLNIGRRNLAVGFFICCFYNIGLNIALRRAPASWAWAHEAGPWLFLMGGRACDKVSYKLFCQPPSNSLITPPLPKIWKNRD